MRTDWIPASASALVLGAFSLVFGAMLNPSTSGQSVEATLRVADEQGTRWTGMALMFVLGAVALTFGLPAVLSLFRDRGRMTGTVGVGIFLVGVLGTACVGVLLMFFRAMVEAHAVRADAVEQAGNDTATQIVLGGWLIGFYLGLVLIAAALVRARAPIWLPLILLAYVASVPFGSSLNRVGEIVQVLVLASAFTGMAVVAVIASQRPLAAEAEPAG